MTILKLGLVHVMGEHDTGKTTFALECGAKPERICFFDTDIKTGSIAKEMQDSGRKFGKYVDVVAETVGMKEPELYDYLVKQIATIKPDMYDVIIFDTWAMFSEIFHHYVETHMKDFKIGWSPKGDIKGSQIWKVSGDLEAIFYNRLLAVSPLVVLITHLKNHTVGSIRTGKQIPDCKNSLVQKANLRVWLRHNPDGAEPIGLILKRISKHVFSDDGIKTVQVLPRRMKPFTWERIKYYWDNPVGNREPTAEETLDEYELSILKGTLTRDQEKVLEIGRIFGEGVGAESESNTPQKEFDNDTIEKVRTLKGEGKAIPLIAKEIGLSIPEIISIINKE